MARVNVYLPDDLADEARRAGLNVSAVTQEALRQQLSGGRTTSWLAEVRKAAPVRVPHDQVLAVLDAARAEAGDEWPRRGDDERS